MRNLPAYLLLAVFPFFAFANFSQPSCALRTLTANELAGVQSPQGLDVYFVTPSLLIGRKPTDEGDWLRIVARDTQELVGCLAIRVVGDSAHVPIYMDRLIRERGGRYMHQHFHPRRMRMREGFGSEAKQAALDYVFGEHSVKKVYARVLATNEPSLSFHSNLGFQPIPREEVPSVFQILDWMAEGPITYLVLVRPISEN